MNAEIVNKSIDAAQAAIKGLSREPVILAIVVFQFITLGAVLYSSLDRQRAVSAAVTELHGLLDKCVAGHINN
jgi:hypothetical protein